MSNQSLLLFLAVAMLVWLGAVHGVALAVFGMTAKAAGMTTAGFGLLLAGAAVFLSREYRNAIEISTEEPMASTQDLNLLMLSRSVHTPRPWQYRRTRTRPSGHHPVMDRIATLHRPPHLDRRIRKRVTYPELSLVDLPKSDDRAAPSTN